MAHRRRSLNGLGAAVIALPIGVKLVGLGILAYTFLKKKATGADDSVQSEVSASNGGRSSVPLLNPTYDYSGSSAPPQYDLSPPDVSLPQGE